MLCIKPPGQAMSLTPAHENNLNLLPQHQSKFLFHTLFPEAVSPPQGLVVFLPSVWCIKIIDLFCDEEKDTQKGKKIELLETSKWENRSKKKLREVINQSNDY